MSADFSVNLKFRGTHIESIPTGNYHLECNRTGNHYTWPMLKTVFKGFIFKKISAYTQGEINIVNHKTNEVSLVKFFKHDSRHKVTSIIRDSKNLVRYLLEGNYYEGVQAYLIRNPRKINSMNDLKLLDFGPPSRVWIRNIPK